MSGKGRTDSFSLIHKGVRFNQFVGVLQVHQLTIEVLPKINRHGNAEPDDETWRSILIQMLRESGITDVRESQSSALRVSNHTVLDLYIEMFLSECEYLLHNGLLKKYRKCSGNRHVLKDAFSKNDSSDTILRCRQVFLDVVREGRAELDVRNVEKWIKPGSLEHTE